jgi:hypothetical protein
MVTIIILLLSLFIPEPEPDEVYSEKFKPGAIQGTIDAGELAEVSGMIASRKNKGNFWVINDSGNQPRIYLIDRFGRIVHSAWLKNCRNRDWEDLAIKTNTETGEPQLVVADIGDNGARRDHINLLVFDEPDWTNTKEDTIHSIEIINLIYEDGPRDAETLITDPLNNAIYIITKREERVRMYQIPKTIDAEGATVLTLKGTLPYHNITSGDISQDGSEIILKSYNLIFYWQRKGNQSLLDAFGARHELLHYKPEPQGESICWSHDAKGFYTLSEKSWADRQVLFFYERKNVE